MKDPNWVVIHMVRSYEVARQAQDLLLAEGFMVKCHPVYRNLPAQENHYEIAVLKSEAQEARDVLMEQGL